MQERKAPPPKPASKPAGPLKPAPQKAQPRPQPKKPTAEELEKYAVYSAAEIASILKGVRKEQPLVRLRFADTGSDTVVTVLDVDAANKKIILDALTDRRLHALAQRCERLHFEGKHNRVSVIFTTGAAREVDYDGSPALEVAFPEWLSRLQRRDSFRIPVSGCKIQVSFVTEDEKTREPVKEEFSFSLKDVSQTGCCLADPLKRLEGRVGEVFTDCTLCLAGAQPITVSVEVKSSYDAVRRDGQRTRHAGCRFVNLESAKSALIQRFVMRAERERRDRLG